MWSVTESNSLSQSTNFKLYEPDDVIGRLYAIIMNGIKELSYGTEKIIKKDFLRDYWLI